jgi:hypothetical protein
MKRTIDKNRAASGRNLWRLMLGTASLFFLASLSSFGQVATADDAIANDQMGTAFMDYVNTHKDKSIVLYYNEHPSDANAISAVKNAIILENPSLFGLSPENAAELAAAQTALVAQLNFMAAQFAAGMSASDAAYAWEREMASGNAAGSGYAVGSVIGQSSGNNTAAPASAGNGAPTMTAAP